MADLGQARAARRCEVRLGGPLRDQRRHDVADQRSFVRSLNFILNGKDLFTCVSPRCSTPTAALSAAAPGGKHMSAADLPADMYADVYAHRHCCTHW